MAAFMEYPGIIDEWLNSVWKIKFWGKYDLILSGSIWGIGGVCIKADNGSIYCMPFNDSRLKNLLKIIPKEGKDIPTSRNWLDILLSSCWLSWYWCRILNLDPNDDNLSLVGEEVDKCFRTVVLGDYGCIYGRSEKVVIKFNPKYEFI